MKTAFLFPGQGSQSVGMAKDLDPALFERANQVLGRDLKKIVMEGPEEALKETSNTQPALYVAGLTAYKALGAQADFLAGHSLGEYCALQAAGVFSFEDGLKLVQERALAMSEAAQAAPGAMAAVLGMDDALVFELCADQSQGLVQCANFNSPGQVVISGQAAAVAAASERIKAAGALKVVPLAVSGAFHSALMKPAGERLAKAFPSISWNKPAKPVVSNVDAAVHADTASIQKSLVDQLSGAVQWTRSMGALKGLGAERYVECGPGRVLQGLMKKIDKGAPCISVGDTESVAKGREWLKS